MTRRILLSMALVLLAGVASAQTYDASGRQVVNVEAGSFVFADNAAFTLTSDFAAVMGAVRDDALSTLAAVEFDVVPLRVNSLGAVWTTSRALVTDGDAVGTAFGTVLMHDYGGSGTWRPIGGTYPLESYVILDDTQVSAGGSSGGVDGELVYGAVATSAPTYTNATTNMLSLTTAGSVRTDVTASALPTGAATSANQSTANTSLSNIDTNTTGLAGTVSGSELQIDVVTSALPTGAATAANQATANTSLSNIETYATGTETAVELIDDAIYVDDADWTDSTSKHALVGGLYESSPQTITDGDVGPLSLTSDGALRVSGAAGATEYTEDAAAPANPVGPVQSLVRDDAASGQTTTDGDIVARRGTDYGAAYTQIVTSAGAFVDSFGGGTQYAEDAVHASGNTVTMAGVVQQTADSALSGNGDNSLLQVDESGFLKVNIKEVDAAGIADDSAFTAGTTEVTPIGAVFDDTTPDSVNENDVGAPRMSANRNLYTTLRDAAGNERGVNVTASNELNVIASAQPGVDIGDVDVLSSALPTGAATSAAQLPDGHNVTVDNASIAVTNAGTFAVQEDGALLTAAQLSDDVVYVDDADWTDAASKHALVGGLYQSSPQSITDGDVGPLSLTSDGALRVSGGGGGTEYTTNAAAPTDPVGTTVVSEIDAALTTLSTETEGEWTNSRSTAEGALWTQDFNSDAILADTASMDTNLGTLAGAVTGTEFQVDIVADGAGLATAANQLADGHNVTVDNAAGASAVNIQDGGNDISVDWAGTAPPIGAGTEAAALRVTVANNSTGVLSVDDNGATLSIDDGAGDISIDDGGNAITVDGTVTANAGTNLNTSALALETSVDGIEALLTTIDSDTSNLAVVGGGTEAAAVRVTLANNSTGLVSVDDNGGALTVDGTVTANLGATDNAVLDSIADGVQTEGQNGTVPIYCTSTAYLNMTTATTTQIVALVAGDDIYICGYSFQAGGTTTANLVSGTGSNCATSQADIAPDYELTAQAGIVENAGGGNIVAQTDATADAVCVTNSAAENLRIRVSYAQF